MTTSTLRHPFDAFLGIFGSWYWAATAILLSRYESAIVRRVISTSMLGPKVDDCHSFQLEWYALQIMPSLEGKRDCQNCNHSQNNSERCIRQRAVDLDLSGNVTFSPSRIYLFCSLLSAVLPTAHVLKWMRPRMLCWNTTERVFVNHIRQGRNSSPVLLILLSDADRIDLDFPLLHKSCRSSQAHTNIT